MAFAIKRVLRGVSISRSYRSAVSCNYRSMTRFGICLLLLLFIINFVYMNGHSKTNAFSNQFAFHIKEFSGRHYNPTGTSMYFGRDNGSVESYLHSNLETWSLKPPIFVRPEHEAYFKMLNKTQVGVPLTDNYHTLKDIHVFKSVIVHEKHRDCGFNTAIEEVKKLYKPCSGPHEYDTVTLLMLPGSNSYQHYMDGVLPKIVMINDIFPNNTYIISPKTLQTVRREMDYMGLRYIPKPKNPICVKRVVDVCRLAGIHPYVWRKMHNFLTHGLVAMKNPQKVVYIPRNINTRNGRHVDNEDEVVEYLQSRFPDDLVVFDHKKYSLKRFRQLMLNTRLIFGVNGGGLASNLLFVSPYAKVIDLMLYSYYPGVEMPYFTSTMRGLKYVRVYVSHDKRMRHVQVDMENLKRALDAVEPEDNRWFKLW